MTHITSPDGIRGSLWALVRKHTFGFSRKIFAIIFLIGMLLLLSLSVAVLSVAGGYMRQDLNLRLQNQTQQIGNVIDSYVDQMKRNMMMIDLDRNVIDLLNGGYTAYQAYTIYRDVYRLLDTIRTAAVWDQYYVFDFDNGDILSSDPQNISGDYGECGVPGTDWYREVMASDGAFVSLSDFQTPVLRQGGQIALALRIQSPYRPDTIGIITAVLDRGFFGSIIDKTSYTKIDLLFITDARGRAIYCSNPEQAAHEGIDAAALAACVGRNGSVFTGGRKRYVVHSQLSDRYGWSIACFSDERLMISNLYRMDLTIAGIAALFLLALLFCSALVSNRFTRPLRQLSGMMQAAEAHGYRLEASIQSNDEVEELSRCFNAMVRTVLENQVLRREAEIDALQQQINPHFLYNTLESIKALAALHGNTDIRVMAEKLGDMFRYSINRERSKIVTIADEIEHIRNYITIQKIRYGDRFDVSYAIDEDILPFQILKFTLQPVVENAVFHGIETISENGIITVKGGFAQGDIQVTISDNGAGMDAAALDGLNAAIDGRAAGTASPRTGSIGLCNIQERIRLFFGTAYGIRVQSRPGHGTQVTLTLPAWRESGAADV
jgi:two-component system, sensor histidine kinase YesM